MHIDAAYAGSAFICPEYRPLLDGVEVTQYSAVIYIILILVSSEYKIRDMFYCTTNLYLCTHHQISAALRTTSTFITRICSSCVEHLLQLGM